MCVHVLVAQSCPTFCNSVYCGLPGSLVDGILQARTLERVAIPCSRGSSQPRDQTQVSCIAGGFFMSEAPGKPLPAVQETRVQSLDWEDPLEKGMATHSSILAWRTPWREPSEGTNFADILVWTTSLPNFEEINFCCLSHPVCGTLV